MKDLISIVIPAYNEEAVMEELVFRLTYVLNKLSSFNFEIIIVENGSMDATLVKLLAARKKDKRIKILQLAKNEGCDGAIVAGLTYARGQAAIVMMADLQDIPELIPEFIQKWKSGYEIVYGIVKKRKGVRITRKIGTYIFYKIINFITKGAVPENVSDFRLLDKKVYSVIAHIPEHNKFFRGLVVWTGYRRIGISFDRPKRFAGESKADFSTALSVAINGIIAFSNFPLHIPWIFSIILFMMSVFLYFTNGFFSFLVLFSFSVVFGVLGIQSEYIGRIFEEVRKRPNFIVQNAYGIEVDKQI